MYPGHQVLRLHQPLFPLPYLPGRQRAQDGLPDVRLHRQAGEGCPKPFAVGGIFPAVEEH